MKLKLVHTIIFKIKISVILTENNMEQTQWCIALEIESLIF